MKRKQIDRGGILPIRTKPMSDKAWAALCAKHGVSDGMIPIGAFRVGRAWVESLLEHCNSPEFKKSVNLVKRELG